MKKFNKNSIAVLVIAFTLGLAGIVVAATTVNLGTADSFAVLAGSGITNTGTTVINGDVGSHPTTTQTGFGTVTVNGTNHAGNATTQSAKTDLVTAYTAAGQVTTGVIAANLGGQTLLPGVYEDNDAPDSLSITGTLTLDAAGDANAVFIFKTGTTLTTAAASSVTLINGAQACNVFWQVGSSATLGTNSTFRGNILAMSSITDNGGSTVEGRFLARNGAVTLNNTTITKATCVVPPQTGGVGGTPQPAAANAAPLINITKIPSPLNLPDGAGLVTYNYVATNVGIVPMHNVKVVDNKCPTVIYVSGDTNTDSRLDINEVWNYSCTMNVALTTTNTVTATGEANGYTAIDTANATVVVSAPIVPPLIHIFKRPNIFILPAGGGAVTYTYLVTNPGTVPLDNVSVIDDKCTGLPGRVVNHPGDLNKNNLLESNETWQFTCLTNLTQTTTNIGTAEGHANGLTALDFSPATVVVSVVPKLPNTGISPDEKSIPWNIIVPAGILAILTSLYFNRRKRTT